MAKVVFNFRLFSEKNMSNFQNNKIISKQLEVIYSKKICDADVKLSTKENYF